VFVRHALPKGQMKHRGVATMESGTPGSSSASILATAARLNAIEPDILAEARLAATNPRMLAHTPAAKPDTLDPNIKAVTLNGVTTFWGESFVRGMSRPGRRVVGWNTSTGPVLASGNTRWG
jgi:hypothetical protein